MSENGKQPDADVMEWIAFASVVVFGLGMAYAIHITNETVDSIETNHYSGDIVQSEQIDQANTDTEGDETTDQNQSATGN